MRSARRSFCCIGYRSRASRSTVLTKYTGCSTRVVWGVAELAPSGGSLGALSRPACGGFSAGTAVAGSAGSVVSAWGHGEAVTSSGGWGLGAVACFLGRTGSSLSATRTALAVCGIADKYSFSGSSALGATMTGGIIDRFIQSSPCSFRSQ